MTTDNANVNPEQLTVADIRRQVEATSLFPTVTKTTDRVTGVTADGWTRVEVTLIHGVPVVAVFMLDPVFGWDRMTETACPATDTGTMAEWVRVETMRMVETVRVEETRQRTTRALTHLYVQHEDWQTADNGRTLNDETRNRTVTVRVTTRPGLMLDDQHGRIRLIDPNEGELLGVPDIERAVTEFLNDETETERTTDDA